MRMRVRNAYNITFILKGKHMSYLVPFPEIPPILLGAEPAAGFSASRQALHGYVADLVERLNLVAPAAWALETL